MRGGVRGYAAAAGLTAVALLTAACAGGGDTAGGRDAKADAAPVSSVGPPSTTGPTKGASAGPGADEPGRTVTNRPADPLAKAPAPVLRGGRKPSPRYTAPPAAFSGKAAYSDGVSLAITKVEQGTVQEQGPGAFTGDPKTMITVALTNGSKAAIKLDQVVVSARYGSPARVARPTYGSGAKDFSGTVAPGKTATATYSFSVPTTQLKNVTMAVDFDGLHAAATFRGPVK